MPLRNLNASPIRNNHTASRSCWCQPTAYALCEACGGLAPHCEACGGDGLVTALPGDEAHSYCWLDHHDPYSSRRKATIVGLGTIEDIDTGEPLVIPRDEVVGLLKAMIEG